MNDPFDEILEDVRKQAEEIAASLIAQAAEALERGENFKVVWTIDAIDRPIVTARMTPDISA